MNKVLLDTNCYSSLLRGNEQVAEALNDAREVIFSVVVMAELLAGFKGGQKEKENLAIMKRFLSKASVRIATVQQSTAPIFAEIKHDLKRKGRPIPINDIWIAAHNVEYGSLLLTFDRHFQAIDGLRLWQEL